jgi:type I restriction enzyme S subunit
MLHGTSTKPNSVVSTGFVVISAKDSIEPYFLYSFLTQEDITEYLDVVAEGSTSAYPAFTPDVIEKLPILLPPIPEQRAIAGVLSSLDDKIDLLHRQNKTLECMAEALWRKMFVLEADPGWKKGRLGDVVEETIGGDWGDDIQSNDLMPVICLRGVDLQHIKESGFSSEAPIRFIKPTSLEKRKLNENEILIAGSGIGPIGKSIPINSALLKCYSYPVIYSNFCKRLRAESKEMAYFIEFMIYQFYKEGELDQFHMGTSVPNFNLKDFLNYEITIPPRDIISFFSFLLADWYTKKFTNQIRTLSRLRDTLLPKLISGEVRVT